MARLAAIFLVILSFCLHKPALSQERAVSQDRKSAMALRIAPSAKPVIDGRLDDAIWRQTTAISDFSQVEPVQGAIPSEQTRVRFAHDEDHLYIAIEAMDSDPGNIAASVMRRDGDLSVDDAVTILIDTNRTGRDAYVFSINGVGARFDGLLENNSTVLDEWDTIWSARARITDDGWTAEIAIPFRSISFDSSIDSWGLQIVRTIARKNEELRWTSINQSRDAEDMSDVGALEGIENVRSGRGLDIVTYGTVVASHDWQDGKTTIDAEPSGDIYYRFTPSLTGVVTLNTDFSDAPLDARQVNTGRFSLFFPETRDFFLQDAGVFEFGGRPFLESPNGSPFFSRRIGFVDGRPVDIDYGGKLSGTLGRYNIGALSVRTKQAGDVEEQQLSALRLSTNILDESKIGMILTRGDPTGETRNMVGGMDFQYKTSDLSGGNRLTADAFYLRSDDGNGGKSDEAYGFEVAYPNDKWFVRLRYKQFGEDYNPALGFANRVGIKDHLAYASRRWRPKDSALRTVDMQGVVYVVTDMQGNVESREYYNSLSFRNQPGDRLLVNHVANREVLASSFFLPGGVVIPAGDYSWYRGSILFETSPARRVSFFVQAGCCDWYDGENKSLYTLLNYRPSKYFNISGSFFRRALTLPAGSVTIDTMSMDADINFSPDMQFVSQLQYDNISESLSYSGRLRWQYRPETEVNLTLGYSAQTDFDYHDPTGMALSFKIGNTFRF